MRNSQRKGSPTGASPNTQLARMRPSSSLPSAGSFQPGHRWRLALYGSSSLNQVQTTDLENAKEFQDWGSGAQLHQKKQTFVDV